MDVDAERVRSEWRIERTEAVGRGGMVAAKTPQAAEVGAAVLRAGGNAVDAAVATAFVAGVAEPWMNGIGGGGYMIVQRPGEAAQVVEFPMVAPTGATPEMFPLAGSGADAALFGWPAVVGGANVAGPRAVAVPGVVAGLALAVERFGRRRLAELIEPAIRFARDGVPVTWHTTLTVARDLATLRRFPATAAVFCPDGLPPVTTEQNAPALLRQPDLARTLELIALNGPRVFYDGPLAREMVAHLSAGGAPFTESDFAAYEANVSPALTTDYAGYEIATTGGGSGGTTLVEGLNLLAALDAGALGHNTPAALHRMAQAFRQAFADRFAYLGDPRHVDVPLATLTDAAYARERAAASPANRLGPVRAGDPARLGVSHGLGASLPEYVAARPDQPEQMADGSTTHLSVIDDDGMAVSLTQTLLSLWGSRVLVPGTGVLLNNGMMWFDPEPGRPNSVAGGKRPLSNMAPLVVSRGGRPVAAVGSSGGRRIMNCHAQLVQNLLDHGLSMQPAVSAPRIDASTVDLLVSHRLPPETREALAALGHRVAVRDERLFTGDFASPAAVLLGEDGRCRGGVDPFYFPATAVGAEPA